jgi:hypothetical protein
MGCRGKALTRVIVIACMHARYNNCTSCPVSKFELPTKARQFFGCDSVA